MRKKIFIEILNLFLFFVLNKIKLIINNLKKINNLNIGKNECHK
jgi:hypothetical protein